MARVPKMAGGKISLAHGVHGCPNYIYIYISYHLQSVNAFPLLSNNNEMETFFYKLGAVRSVDWIFII